MSKNLLKTKYALIVAVLALGSAVLPLLGSEHHGTVKFGGLPLPGATVTAKPMNAKEGDKTFSAISDLDGRYSFPDLPDGTWTIRVEMPLFSPMQQEVTVAAGAAASDWDLKLLPARPDLRDRDAGSPAAGRGDSGAGGGRRETARNGKAAPPAPTNTATAFQRTDLNAAAANANNEAPAPASDTAPSGNQRRKPARGRRTPY